MTKKSHEPSCSQCGDSGYVVLVVEDNKTIDPPRAETCPWRCKKSAPISALIGHRCEVGAERAREAVARALADAAARPIPMHLDCPFCHAQHIDEGASATMPHRTHACQKCGRLWAPAVVPTVGVRFLPGCKNEEPSS